MPHGQSWLSLNPLYAKMEHAIQGFGPSWLFKHEVYAQHLASMLLVALVIALLSVRARAQLSSAGGDILPETTLSARGIVELIMDFFLKIMQFAMPVEASLRHFWLLGTLAFFILFSNLLGLLPGFVPPTENFNCTFACGSMVFVYYNAYAFYRLGLGHLAHMANPVGVWWGWFLAPLFLPVEMISHCIRPCSLSIRLMCNIAGDHMVMAVFLLIFPLLLPLPLLALGLLVALLQTVVFLLLSSVYIGEVEAMVAQHHAAHAHEGEHGAAHAMSAEVAAH